MAGSLWVSRVSFNEEKQQKTQPRKMINFVDLGLSCLWRKCPAEVAGRILLSNFRMFSVNQYSCNKTAREDIWSMVRNVSMIGAEQHSVFFIRENQENV